MPAGETKRVGLPRAAVPTAVPTAVPDVARRWGKRAVRGYGMLTSPLRPLPDFLIIGTKRGGTTSLYRLLQQHPGVAPLFPSAARLPMREDQKGVHFFDTNHGAGVPWYRSHFPTALHRRRLEQRVAGPVVVGEASPYYLFHPLAAGRTARVVPGARLIVLLRDPVERAHSHYKERRREGVETLSFEDALAAEPARLAGEEERLRAEPDYRSFAHEHLSYFAQGLYAEPLARWAERYPPDRMLVLRSEDFYADPQQVVDRIFGFLRLPPHTLAGTGPWNATAASTMPAATRRMLAERYAEPNRRLERQLGTDLGWDS